jgi:hypothetical protein
MDNKYLEHATHEVQVVLNCDKDKALRVVSWVNCLGGDPVEFIHRLPGFADEATPNVDELLATLSEIARQNNVRLSDICFPTDYENRATRRQARKTKQGQR